MVLTHLRNLQSALILLLLLLLRARRGEEVHEPAAPSSALSRRAARLGLAASEAESKAVTVLAAKVEAVVCKDVGEAGDGVHVQDLVQVETGVREGCCGLRLLLLLLRFLIGQGWSSDKGRVENCS